MIDGLESVYTQSEADTLQVVLKALKNRKHIYVVNLSDSYAALKARERAQRETEGKHTHTDILIQRTELIKLIVLLFLFSKVYGIVQYVKTVYVCPSEALQKERADREEQWLQELDDDEYNDLPEEEIERIVYRNREKRRQQKLRY